MTNIRCHRCAWEGKKGDLIKVPIHTTNPDHEGKRGPKNLIVGHHTLCPACRRKMDPRDIIKHGDTK